MGITKKHIHSERRIALARLYKALGHPARLAIVENLLNHDNMNCSDLKKHIQLAQSTLSAHIKELQEVGILGVRVDANKAYYQVDKAELEILNQYTEKIIEKTKFVLKPNHMLLYRKAYLTRFPLQSIVSMNTT